MAASSRVLLHAPFHTHSRFRMAWDALREVAPARANRRYLEILQLAAQEGEVQVDEALHRLLEDGEIGEGKLNVEVVKRQDRL